MSKLGESVRGVGFFTGLAAFPVLGTILGGEIGTSLIGSSKLLLPNDYLSIFSEGPLVPQILASLGLLGGLFVSFVPYPRIVAHNALANRQNPKS